VILTVSEILEVAARTGETQTMTKEERENFRAEFAAAIVPDIERIRADRRQAFFECQHLVLD
jgi:hypothetical protein